MHRIYVSLLLSSLLVLAGAPVLAQQQSRPHPAAAKAGEKVHRVMIQVTQNDPAVMTMALNNAENLAKYYADKGEKVEIEFVTFGQGLHMVRSDTSPVKDRIASIRQSSKNITFSACANTLASHAKAENKNITLIPEAQIVPTGIGRVVALSEQGWTYVRP
jgi:intracellular sulfur oxidation DsrE/DsrF family protein